MPTAITLVNNALRELGAEPISSFTEGTTLANTCADVYPVERDAILRTHPWNFATFQATLSPIAGANNTPLTPALRWAYQYLQPTDPYCLQVIRTAYARPFQVGARRSAEGMQRIIYSDENPLMLEYIGRVEVLDYWDAAALLALQKSLEAALAITVTGQQSKKQVAQQEAVFRLTEAHRSDGQEGTPRQVPLPLALWYGRFRGSRLLIGEGTISGVNNP